MNASQQHRKRWQLHIMKVKVQNEVIFWLFAWVMMDIPNQVRWLIMCDDCSVLELSVTGRGSDWGNDGQDWEWKWEILGGKRFEGNAELFFVSTDYEVIIIRIKIIYVTDFIVRGKMGWITGGVGKTALVATLDGAASAATERKASESPWSHRPSFTQLQC